VPHGVILERAETSLGAIELFTFDRHRHAFPRHAHEVLTLGVFGAGNGMIRVRGGAHRAAPGALLALAPNEVHSAEPLRGTGWTYRSICPSATLLSHALDGAGGFSFEQPVIADSALAQEVGEVHGTLSQGTATLETEVRVVELLRRAVARHASQVRGPSAPPRDVAARASALMESRLASPLLLADIARECSVSPFQLIRAFHSAFGVPPHAYLMQARLRRARALLQGGEEISTAAFSCGFVDQSHLTKVFKRYYGMTPGAYTGRKGVRA
jgi:AraC-like DNA-binding protein